MEMIRPSPVTVIICALFFGGGPVNAASLGELVDRCEAAAKSGDQVEFGSVEGEVRALRNVFDTARIAALEECLTDGSGETWFYHPPSAKFMTQTEYEVSYRIAEEAKRRTADAEAKARAEARDLAKSKADNASRVAALVYASCNTLFRSDQVAAMTNQLCVESFLTSGLPQP